MRVVRYYPRAIAGDGGMTAAVHSWARAAATHGAHTTIVCERSDTCEAPVLDGGATVRPIDHRRIGGFSIPVGLGECLRNADVLVLHSGWTSYNLAAARTARRLGIPYVLEPRGAYDPAIVQRHRAAKQAWWYLAERNMVQHALAVHVFFEDQGAHLARLGYHGPIVVAPNGVQPVQGQWDGGSGDYLLWLGRFDPEHKGLDLLLGAMAVLPEAQRPHLRLHGPDWRGRKSGVADMIRAQGLQDYAEICPSVHGDEKTRVQERARAFVYPSRWEAFGNSVAEAAMLGAPILTTRYPLGLFLEGRGAAITSASTPDAIAGGIDQILRPDAATIGACAKEVAQTEFTWARITESWLEQVTALLAAQGSAARW
jgi:glycosyltransferase involved in cell wall biosynthesis